MSKLKYNNSNIILKTNNSRNSTFSNTEINNSSCNSIICQQNFNLTNNNNIKLYLQEGYSAGTINFKTNQRKKKIKKRNIIKNFSDRSNNDLVNKPNGDKISNRKTTRSKNRSPNGDKISNKKTTLSKNRSPNGDKISNRKTTRSKNRSDKCTYTVALKDSYGDGWNGASLDVSINGELNVLNENITIDSGFEFIHTFEVSDGDAITTTFNPGSYDSECSYVIKNSQGFIVHDSDTVKELSIITPILAICNDNKRILPYTIELKDSYGDGWDDNYVDKFNTLNLLVNDSIIFDSLYVEDTDFDNVKVVNFDVVPGDTITADFYPDKHTFPTECSFVIYDENQNEVLSKNYSNILINTNDSLFIDGEDSIYWGEGFTSRAYSVPFNDLDEDSILDLYDQDIDGDNVINKDDAFPNDSTQIKDADGDGYGDNPAGNNPDALPNDSTQIEDADGDGYGDNPDGNDPDAFPDDSTQWKDADGDGYGDNIYGNDVDAFPFDSTQWADTDGDGYGENLDGHKPDEFPTDPTQWKDTDGDGYGDNQITKPDAFPSDSTQWADTDGDGHGDNIDNCPTVFNPDQSDINNDGIGDACDEDIDSDGIGNNEDLDDDGDDVLDVDDAFPLNSSEQFDTDGDGVGDNADIDDDDDGVIDVKDAFPLDKNENLDTDGDGVGDNADFDDDGDGVLDFDDALPLNPSEQFDTDGDEVGDNADIFNISNYTTINFGIGINYSTDITELLESNIGVLITYDIGINGVDSAFKLSSPLTLNYKLSNNAIILLGLDVEYQLEKTYNFKESEEKIKIDNSVSFIPNLGVQIDNFILSFKANLTKKETELSINYKF